MQKRRNSTKNFVNFYSEKLNIFLDYLFSVAYNVYVRIYLYCRGSVPFFRQYR